jgi:hypothetical protein
MVLPPVVLTSSQGFGRTLFLKLALAVFSFILPLLFANLSHAQETKVELELVLSADASSSIRGTEFDLQVTGYANAFRDQGVIEAIRELGDNGIAVMFVQWSAMFQQVETVPWMHIRTRADAEGFAVAIEGQARRFTSFGTATGAAMEHAADLIEKNGYDGSRKVIDISSDERSNQGPHPVGIREAILARGITINGLVVLDDDEDLTGYFQQNVIGGEDAFVLAVESYEDFAEAIRLKLIREISAVPVADAGGSPAMALNGLR